MHPDQIDLVQESFEQLLPMADALAARFYERLFDLDPALRSLFPADMAGQRHKLMGTLDAAVVGLWSLDAIAPTLRDLGLRHLAYGARPEQYALVGEALVGAIGESLGPMMTDEVSAAWRAAFGQIAALMLEGAAGQP